MRYIHHINIVLFSITLLLYIGVFTGLLAQIFLGIAQLLFSLLLLKNRNSLQSKTFMAYSKYTF